MHEAAFARAALPEPAIVLGMRLRAYSIGHEVWLSRPVPNSLESKVWSLKSSPPSPGYGAASPKALLIRAVLICCQTWGELQGMDGDRWQGLKMRLWGWRLRRLNFERERLGFEAYREAGSLEFPLSEIARPSSGQPARPPGAPFLLRLHQFLVTRLQVAPGEAWDYPLGLAKMQWASYWEEEGGLQIYNWQDAEHDAFVAKCEAEEAAQGPMSNVQGPMARSDGDNGQWSRNAGAEGKAGVRDA